MWTVSYILVQLRSIRTVLTISFLSLSLCGRKIGGRGWKDREAKNRSHYSIITAYRLLLGNGIRLTLIIILSHFLLSFLGSVLHSSAENRI